MAQSSSNVAAPFLMAVCAVTGGIIGVKLFHPAIFLPHDLPLTASPTTVSLGNLAEGAAVTATVSLRNISNKPVEIAYVGSSCGCTTSSCPNTIPANGNVKLSVHYDARGANGPVHQSVLVTLKDQARSLLTIPVTASVTKEVALSAGYLDLGDTDISHGALTITRLDKRPLTVVQSQPLPNFNVRIISSVSSARVELSRLQVSGHSLSEMAGSHLSVMELGLNDPRMPTVKVPVYWATPSRFKVRPARVQWNVVAPDKPVKAVIAISARQPEDLSSLAVLSVPQGLTAKVQRAESNALAPAVYNLTISGTLRKGELLDDTVKLRTGNSLEPVISVPLSAVAGSDAPMSSNACIASVK